MSLKHGVTVEKALIQNSLGVTMKTAQFSGTILSVSVSKSNHGESGTVQNAVNCHSSNEEKALSYQSNSFLMELCSLYQ